MLQERNKEIRQKDIFRRKGKHQYWGALMSIFGHLDKNGSPTTKYPSTKFSKGEGKVTIMARMVRSIYGRH